MKKAGKGRVAEAASTETGEFSLIPRETLMKMYEGLVQCRLLGVKRGRKASVDAGWAAVQGALVAVLMDTRAEDLVVSAEASAALRMLRGEKLALVVAKGAKVEKSEPSRQLLHAIGTALASKTAKNGRVVVVFWRDTEPQYWLDVLEMARVHALPLVMVCPAMDADLGAGKKLEPGTELPRITVDGYDAVAVYRVAHEGIERARNNRGATLIECTGFRVNGRRSAKEEDAVALMERYLKGKGMFREGMQEAMAERFRKKLKTARGGARQ